MSAPVLIAGGGVGGLALALMLQARGIPSQVFEAASEVKELGVGINLPPHATAELVELGLLDALDAVAIRTRELRYLNRFGQLIWDEKRGMYAGHKIPQLSLHRGRLHGVMWRAAAERLPAGSLHTGKRLAGFAQDAQGVTARFAAGTEARGSILVGADGIHSALRAALHPDDGGVKWNGIQMWRGCTDWPEFEGGDVMIVAGDMKEKLVLYPVGQGRTPGTRLTNWALCVQLGDPTRPPPRREDWARRGVLEEALPHLQRFRVPWLDVEALVRATPEFYEYPMCDRDPLPWWTDRRVTLLGDAAHPMYPVGSNGASQALLDARCLADLLAQHDAPEALAAYDSERRPRTTDIVTINRRGGPERVVDVVGERAPDGFDDIAAVIARDELAAIIKSYTQLVATAR
jgi:2-polyprenyl-6-methoxyphenol hydroxylase-like FAD-dependent oxidoreductase